MYEYEVRLLEQEGKYDSPFEHDTEGFNDDWWHRGIDHKGSKAIYLQLLVNGVESGRAEIVKTELSNGYIGFDSKLLCREITFFEIRSKFRRQGHGKKFAQLLVEKYANLPVIAFSEQADDFWQGIGWYYYPRKDGETIGYGKLFISREIIHQIEVKE